MPPVHFALVILKMGVGVSGIEAWLQTYPPNLISASQGARIIGMSHQLQLKSNILNNSFC
jgi:hypothetical protein